MLETFRNHRKALEADWSKGECGDVQLRKHSAVVDQYIVEAFRRTSAEGCDDIALLALGGYGREELFPFSDIDLMILYRPEIKGQINSIADGVLYPLWDTGLEVGHGVRTIRESMIQAEEDYFFLVALLDARLIHGSQELFSDLISAYRQRFVEGQRESFVENMKHHLGGRREKFGGHNYLLEPHIKEGRGGMRDIQAMMWTARVVFGLNGLDGIEEAGLMMPDEKADFIIARDALVKLRGYMHYISKRKSDQLYFELQCDIAEAFGYREGHGMRAVEHFMRDVYGALQKISITTDLFFDHVDEVLGVGQKSIIIPDKAVEKGIEVKSGRVHLTASHAQLVAKPQILVRVFLVMARTGLMLHHRTRKMISGELSLITDKERNSPRLSKTFFTLLHEAKDIDAVLEAMLETGVLGACIPEYTRITSLAQHDLYHIYTVDRHSLKAVAELHKVINEWATISQNVISLRVLYLAALLHDIGKGSGRDHSEQGAEMAREIGVRFSFSEEECENLSFVVKYHLFIPENALRRDLNDAIFIKRCAETIDSLDKLAMLYLLSVADSKATGPSAWSEWKATLMEEMYLKIYPYLDTGRNGVHDVLAHEEQGVEWLRDQVRLLLKGEEGVKVDLMSLAPDYVLTFSPQIIVSHILTQRDNYTRLRQKSLIKAADNGDSWSLLIMTVDRPGLLAKICGVMTLNNLTVGKAQIFTWEDGTVVDVLDVRPTDDVAFEEKDWPAINEQLDMAIAHRMGLSHRLYRKHTPVYGRQSQIVGDVDSKVIIDNESSESYTVLEVYAPDLPGQLYYITQAMADFGINIHKAYIATEVEQLIDVFYVLDSRGQKLVDEDFVREITEGILHFINLSAQ